MLAANVAVVGGDHRFDLADTPMQFAGRPGLRLTSIGADVWIGHGAVVMAGSRIGAGAIVGAGAVVTTDIPPREVWGGVPARCLRRRFQSTADDKRHQEMITGRVLRAEFADPR